MKIAILGAGGGGASAAVELSQAGHEIRLWNRSAAALEGFIAAGGVRFEGVLGDGLMPVPLITPDLRLATRDADAGLICLPTMAHAGVAALLIDAGVTALPLILNPGHSGGALEVANQFHRAGLQPPPIAEFSTLTYVARKPAADRVNITGRAKAVWAAAMPGGQAALAIAQALYHGARQAPDVLATALANVNMVLHPPGAILGAAWVEARQGDFTFYVEGLTDGVARVMTALDQERLAVAAAFGHDLPDLFHEMQAIGTIEAGANPAQGLATAIRAGTANARIKAPDSLAHRYYREDLWYGLMPFLALADIARTTTPTAQALFHLGTTLVGPAMQGQGRGKAAMGLEGLDKASLLAKLRAGTAS